MSRAAATALVVLLAAACTAGPNPPGARATIETVDLDNALGTDVTVLDLVPTPGGPPVALVSGAGRSWLVAPATGVVREIPAAEPGSRLVITHDDTPLVVGTALTRVGGEVLPLPLGGPPTAALIGDTLYVARDTRLAAVDAGTGEVRATATAPAPVTHLAEAPDGGLAVLVDHPNGVVLLWLTPDLRPDGDPVAVVPEQVSTPTDLEVTADGTVVVTAYVGRALDAGRLVTVVDGAVPTAVDLAGTDDTALDVAVDGRSAYVVLSAAYHPAELTAVDLVTGEVTGVAGLCGGAGAFGAVAADGDTLTVVGSCTGADPHTTAFLVG
ncbi:hypothetical protein SAMN05660464_0042 [Geodermatophilus dictyosporus]|uniref:DNA-binding beta-propeller fold protein YncE n=1 Tax=Geodermatophilus dictyosporus TaxID=1523247 RepID=A0A1I5U304_9ACTN|nr:hypothetical protein [Geodermatophilus dictyosporus]SFP89678.1 hypothetical protein SAMN05660464_0042 [Geodermatophilus dictyosporus]